MEAAKLNQTFIPKEIIKKTQITNQNAILTTNQFEKTGGNPYIQFDPTQVKFNGYELGKTQSAVVKVINKSPIPQRVHILPPTEPGFSIKVSKKGPIAAGMSENIQVFFVSDVFKYQYDVIKVNSQTGNFVVPIYAYPSIPKISQVFPKIIDFGNVVINESNSYLYPINNPVPIDFPYQFKYIQQSPAFIITPIKGTIFASSTQNIQITFVPSQKKTFVAQAIFHINQFDFEPIKIKIFGSGVDKKQPLNSTKRIKSSKLNPLIKQQSKKNEPVQTQNIKALDLNNTNQKKTFLRSRTSYPKLVKKTTGLNNATSTINQANKLQVSFKKQGEREYLGQFSKIQELDKEKQIKFVQYLGDRPMNDDETQFQIKVDQQTKKARLQAFKQFCFNRHEPELKGDAEIDLTKVLPQTTTWDIKKNDQLKLRKIKLQAFMKAGSKIIAHYRLIKRLGKIKQFLSDCKTKEDVRKKVQQDFAKSRDQSIKGFSKAHSKLDFTPDMLQACSFPLQFRQQGQSVKKIFQTQGSTNFDDDKMLKQIQPHQTEMLNYGNMNFSSDFMYLTRKIPAARSSAQEEYPLKTSSLPEYKLTQPSSVYKLPLKVPTHQFIYNGFELNRYKTANPVDEKDPEYLIDATLEHVEDEFEGWSKGDMDILKAKFQRNMGIQFSGISLYNYPQTGDFGFYKQFDLHLPRQIGNNQIGQDDMLEEGDSDQQKMNNIQTQKVDSMIAKLQEKSSKAKQRRQKGQFSSYQLNILSTVDKNLQKVKLRNIAQSIDKIYEYNKWAENPRNKILI